MRNSLLFVVVAAVLGAGACLAQDVKSDDANQSTSEEDFSLDKLMAELDEPESEKERTGTDLLDEAMALKLSASTLNDIERILELSQKALDKGLTAEEEKMARGLMRMTLLQRAAVTAEILRDGRADSEREIAIVARIGLEDLKRIKDVLDAKETEKKFEGADVYWYIKATLLAYSGQDDKDVLEAVQIAKKLNSENNARLAQLLYMEATVQSVDKEKLLELMTQAYEKDPDSEAIERAYIIALARNDKLEKASKLILPIVDKEKDCDPAYAVIMSEYYQQSDKSDKALEWLNKIPKPASDSPRILMSKLVCAIDLADTALALDLSMKILNQDPQNIQIRILRTRLLMEDEKYDDALKEVNLAMFFEEDSTELKMLKSLILCHKDKKNYDDARKEIESVLKDDNSDVETLGVAYRIASVLKDAKLRLQIIERIIKLDDKNVVAYNQAPTVYIILKEYDKAVEAFEKNIELFPGSPTALNNYSWFLSTIDQDSHRNGKKALELALKAAQATDYKEAYILSTLAAAYAENGDFENAVKMVQKALDNDKDDKLKQELKDELESYKQKKPIRESSESWDK